MTPATLALRAELEAELVENVEASNQLARRRHLLHTALTRLRQGEDERIVKAWLDVKEERANGRD